MSRRGWIAAALAALAVAAGLAVWLLGGDDETGGGVEPGARADLDSGVVVTVGDAHAFPHAVVVAGDGAIVAATESHERGAWTTALVRFDPDGRRRANVPVPLTNVVDAAAGPDGTVVVLGRRDGVAAIARVTADGRLDPGFGDKGIAPGGTAVPRALAVARDGHVAVAGDNATRGAIELSTVDPRGTAAQAHILIPAPGGAPSATAGLAYTREGALLVGGSALGDGGATGAPLLARVEGDRVTRTTTIPTELASARWTDLVAYPDGSAALVGSARFAARSVVAAARFTAGGEADPGFGEGGVISLPVGDGEAFAGAAGPAPRGGLFVAADTGDSATLIHLGPDGARDGRFSRPRAGGRATSLAFEDDGSVLVLTSQWSRPRQSVGLRRVAGLGAIARG